MKAYKVYMHIFPNHKVYIGITGQSLRARFNNGRGYNGCPKMHKAIMKYGWDNVLHIVLFENLSKEEAEQKEIELIKKYKSNIDEYGYNIESGGNCAGTHSEETKKKISEGNKGKKLTLEQRMKMSEIRKGKQVGKNNGFYGKHHKESVKQKQSEAMKNNTYFKGHHHTEEFKIMKSAQMSKKYSNGNHPRCKRVLCLDDDENVVCVYVSLRDAAIKIGISPSALCKAVQKNVSKKGYYWRYENEQ